MQQALDNDLKEREEVFAEKYNDIVKEHFFNPKNFLRDEAMVTDFEKVSNGVGQVGSPACLTGDTLIAVADGRIAVKTSGNF